MALRSFHAATEQLKLLPVAFFSQLFRLVRKSGILPFQQWNAFVANNLPVLFQFTVNEWIIILKQSAN